MIIIKSLTEATDISDQEASQMWGAMQNSPFKQLMEYEFEKRATEERAKLETVNNFEEFHKQRGVLEGIRICVGILNRTKK